MTLPEELSAPPNGQSSLWAYFHKFRGWNYKDDQTHKAAWCKACVKSRCREIQQADEVAATQGGIENVRTIDDSFELGVLRAVFV